ncbi:hypothetical protein PTTG_03314 [Puccinia triticina 1-1 BBBD Race 1]|uniref:DDE Tnp4 domain-containing protein n=1 Tax=Puccinia triticina (isolate 1-1 / race 1 (BBBD)) TaxID=630390 RepID=A0A180G5D9_PUCT1|nr:hypothetical protein PTTG_03314 [Puccinia triticina 1-1 BBBD Race 1]
MVRTSTRKSMICQLESAIEDTQMQVAVLGLLGLDEGDSSDSSTDSSDDSDKDFEINQIYDLQTTLAALLSSRYLAHRNPVAKPPFIHEYLMHDLDEKRFKQEFRMSRSAFLKLCDQVSNDPVYHNNSQNPQRHVCEQMMVALKRLGCFGNAASVGMMARFFRLAEGTVELYTDRCIMAILRLQNQLLNWPNEEKRKSLKDQYCDLGFDGCIGLIDGTLVVLHECPQKDGYDYYSRKGFYAIATLIACDQEKNITYVYTGWPGCSHDQRMTSNSGLTKTPNNFFSDGEYILADSAFAPTPNIVPAFRRQRGIQLTDDQHKFNH